MANPYSADRHASPELFCGYADPATRAPGAWTLEEIAGSWLQLQGGAPSFWVVGDRKLGKTSLLLRLRYLLRTEGQNPESPRFAVPLYVSCEGVSTPYELYTQILARATEILGEGSAPWPLELDPRQFEMPRMDPPESDLALLDAAIRDLNRLAEQVASASRMPVRLVLLIDDAWAAVEAGWAGTLCDHLRALLSGWPFLSLGRPALREAFAVALASDRDLEEVRGARGLLELLDELPVRSLAATEVTALITIPGPVRLDARWRPRIYQATAGHPWLVQFVMEHIVDAFGTDAQKHGKIFEEIVTDRFQRSVGGAIFGHYLERFQEDVRVLAHLTLNRQGSSLKELAGKTGMSAAGLTERLEAMIHCGILYQPPGEAQDEEGRYALGEIFMHWFLAHTGGAVLLAEIERLSAAERRERTQQQFLNAPFTLTLGVNPDFLLADGLYTRLIDLGNDLTKILNRIKILIRKQGDKEFLDLVADDLKDALHQREWEPIWNDYVEKAPAQGRDPRFVLRVGNVDLFQFPIEIVSLNERPLGLERPVYKELMAGQRAPAYRLSRNLLSPETELNVLLVGSSGGGEYDQEEYPELTYVEQEVSEIISALQVKDPERRLRIGRIVALVDSAEELPAGVQKDLPSAANLARALRGGFGSLPPGSLLWTLHPQSQ